MKEHSAKWPFGMPLIVFFSVRLIKALVLSTMFAWLGAAAMAIYLSQMR